MMSEQAIGRRPLMSGRPARRLDWCAALMVVCAAVGVHGQAPARETDARELARRAAARIGALQREADALASSEQTLLDQLRRLEVERDLRTVQFEQGERDLAGIENELRTTGAHIQDLETRSRQQASALASRMVELYKLGRAGYVRLLLNVEDPGEAGRAYRFVSALQQLDRQRVAEHGRTLAELRGAQTSLDARLQARVALQGQMGVARQSAEHAAADQAALIRRIDQRRDLAAQLMGELQTAQQRLQRRLVDFERDGASAATSALSLPLRPFRGDLDWPVGGPVIGTFGRQLQARFNTATISNGIRIAASRGTPVVAIHDGTVVFAAPFTGFGNLVIVDHGAQAFTMYGTLADVTVSAGTHVVRGQRVGTAGASPEGVASMYFELRVDGKPVDPLQWLRKK
ncbi:MAG: peptidoglycan DD-metalloendopeptidase family protein [Acidobacteriota bacterium]